jgi:hypothetical protein
MGSTRGSEHQGGHLGNGRIVIMSRGMQGQQVLPGATFRADSVLTTYYFPFRIHLEAE